MYEKKVKVITPANVKERPELIISYIISVFNIGFSHNIANISQNVSFHIENKLIRERIPREKLYK